MIVSAQVEGQPLVELRANVGDRVRTGQVLARFDTEMLRAEVSRLTRRSRAGEGGSRTGECRAGTRPRARGQRRRQRAGSHATRDRRTGRGRPARRSRKHNSQPASWTLQRADVAAPDDGTISARDALPEWSAPSGLELFRIIRRDRLEWRGELTAAQLLRAAPGQQVLLSLPGGAMALARIRHLAPSMNPQTRLAIVYADIEPGESARAGTYVNGRIVLGQVPALVVPASAIVVRDGDSFAFTLISQERSSGEQQRVEVGRRMGRDVEILSGSARAIAWCAGRWFSRRRRPRASEADEGLPGRSYAPCRRPLLRSGHAFCRRQRS